jgi:hypothetical protein
MRHFDGILIVFEMNSIADKSYSINQQEITIGMAEKDVYNQGK